MFRPLPQRYPWKCGFLSDTQNAAERGLSKDVHTGDVRKYIGYVLTRLANWIEHIPRQVRANVIMTKGIVLVCVVFQGGLL